MGKSKGYSRWDGHSYCINNNAIEPELLIDISKLEELKGIKVIKNS